MILSTTPVQTKTCRTCWRDKPISEFRRRRRGSNERHAQCRTCYAAYMRQYRQARRSKEVAAFWMQAASPRCSSQAVVALTEAMVSKAGGPEGLATAWKEQLDAARAARPGGQAALRCFRAVFRLLEICDRCTG